jgi:hypothetical protein
MEMSIRILTKFSDVREAALVTVHKDLGASTGILEPDFYDTYFISEHSPIRSFIVRIKWKGISRRVAMHLVRHVHSLPFVSSTRPDRFPGHKDDEVVDMIQDFNAQALIDMARKRLCTLAYRDTRQVVEDVKYYLMTYANPSDNELELAVRSLGRCMVPNCIYRSGCPEGRNSCSFLTILGTIYDEESKDKSPLFGLSIRDRYDMYNRWFKEKYERSIANNIKTE